MKTTTLKSLVEVLETMYEKHRYDYSDFVNELKAEIELNALIEQRKPVAWFKHGPYEGDEQLVCVFEDPKDDVNYSPVYFAPEPLTVETIEKIANNMPGGLEGFLKGWGWQQFARAIEKAVVGSGS